MGPNRYQNTGAEFEKKIDSLFFGEEGAAREAVDDSYIEYMEEQDEDDTSDDDEE